MFCVYIISNIKNNKIYIGMTSHPKRRWEEHLTSSRKDKSCMIIHKAIKKYGEDNFIFDITATELSELEALQLEKRLIALYNTTNTLFGYNLLKEGKCYRFSDGKKGEININKSLSHLSKFNILKKGIPLSEAHKNKIRKTATGKKHSEDTIRKMQESNRIYWEGKTEEDRLKQGKHLKGKVGNLHSKRIKCNETDVEYVSIRQANLQFSPKTKTGGSIYYHLNGKLKTAYGHTFSYIN